MSSPSSNTDFSKLNASTLEIVLFPTPAGPVIKYN
jgi:hypothetical protein